jgi:hypothetical protein
MRRANGHEDSSVTYSLRMRYRHVVQMVSHACVSGLPYRVTYCERLANFCRCEMTSQRLLHVCVAAVTILYNISHVVELNSTDVSEEHIAFILGV